MRILSTKIHGILDYLVAIILIVMPWLLNFNGPNAATYVLVTLGVLTIIYSFFTNYEWGTIKIISMSMHLLVDLASGIFLALSPWLLGFNKYIYLPHLLAGIIEIIVSTITIKTPYAGRISGQDHNSA